MIHRTKQGLLVKTDSPMFFGCLGVIVATAASIVLQGGGPSIARADEPKQAVTQSSTGFGPTVEHYGPGVSYEEYCKQVALSCLINSIHEIDDSEVRFKRDPTRPGSAIQQFSNIFGSAIAYRSAPDLLSGSRHEGYVRGEQSTQNDRMINTFQRNTEEQQGVSP